MAHVLKPSQVWVAPGPRVLIVREGTEDGHQGAYLYTEAPQAHAVSLSVAERDALDLTEFSLVAGPDHFGHDELMDDLKVTARRRDLPLLRVLADSPRSFGALLNAGLGGRVILKRRLRDLAQESLVECAPKGWPWSITEKGRVVLQEAS